MIGHRFTWTTHRSYPTKSTVVPARVWVDTATAASLSTTTATYLEVQEILDKAWLYGWKRATRLKGFEEYTTAEGSYWAWTTKCRNASWLGQGAVAPFSWGKSARARPPSLPPPLPNMKWATTGNSAVPWITQWRMSVHIEKPWNLNLNEPMILAGLPL
jgi:hypothetical protein